MLELSGEMIAVLMVGAFFVFFAAVIGLSGLFVQKPTGIWSLYGLQALLTLVLLVPAALGSLAAAAVYGAAGLRCQFEVMTVLCRTSSRSDGVVLSVLTVGFFVATVATSDLISILAMVIMVIGARVALRFRPAGQGSPRPADFLGSLVPAILVCQLIDLVTWETSGFLALFVLFAVVELQDSMGFVAGKLIGRRRLWPSVSPGKTIEGSVAGLALALAAGTPAAHFLLGIDWPLAFVLAVVAAVGGVAGDLGASYLKRRADVKDYPALHPVAGGMTDMFDSLLVAVVPYKVALFLML